MKDQGPYYQTIFSSQLMNGPSRLQCFITLSWNGLICTNILAFWTNQTVLVKLKCCGYYHVRYLATLALGSSNSDQPFQVTTLVPKLAEPFGTAQPTLILDLVFLIQIDSHVGLFIDVYLLKYSYSETRLGRVNKSFNIIRPMFLP